MRLIPRDSKTLRVTKWQFDPGQAIGRGDGGAPPRDPKAVCELRTGQTANGRRGGHRPSACPSTTVTTSHHQSALNSEGILRGAGETGK